MTYNSDISILIPARGGSKRIIDKNVILINEKPLIHYSIEEALKVTNNVFVSTDCQKIKKACRTKNVTVIDRPAHLATDTSDVRDSIRHFFDFNADKILVLMQATSPMVKSKYVFRGLEKMNYFDSIISVCESREFFWNSDGKPINYDFTKKPRTQDMKPLYRENGAFYITRRDKFLSENNLTNGKVGFVVMPESHSIDIDTKEDLNKFKLMLEYEKRCSNG